MGRQWPGAGDEAHEDHVPTSHGAPPFALVTSGTVAEGESRPPPFIFRLSPGHESGGIGGPLQATSVPELCTEDAKEPVLVLEFLSMAGTKCPDELVHQVRPCVRPARWRTRSYEGWGMVATRTGARWNCRSVSKRFSPFCRCTQSREITPPELRFEILTPEPQAIREGTLIDYRLRLYGVAFRWRARIKRLGSSRPVCGRTDAGAVQALDSRASFRREKWEHRHPRWGAVSSTFLACR